MQAAKSDGRPAKAEKLNLMQSQGDADSNEPGVVIELLCQPIDVDALLNAVPRRLDEQLYPMPLMPIEIDSQNEARHLDSLARGLGLEWKTVVPA